MSEKTRKIRAVLPLFATGLIFPAAGSMPVPVTGGAAGDVSEAREAAALYQLGVMRMNGEGEAQDIAAGRYWIHLAARHGYPLAQYNLGVMYFDGIGGEYNRRCAQWWLTRAAAQDDRETAQMAELALQSVLPEMEALPKVYRPAGAEECDQLPDWYSGHDGIGDMAVLPSGDIDTERGLILTETAPVTLEVPPAMDVESVVPSPPAAGGVVSEITTDTAGTDGPGENTETVSSGEEIIGTAPAKDESAEASEMSGAVVTDNVRTETAVSGTIPIESGRADEMQEPAENREAAEKPDAEAGDEKVLPDVSATGDGGESNDEITGQDIDGSSAGKNKAPETKKILAEKQVDNVTETERVKAKPERKPAPVLNLGGSPATAPGKHYTLQLSGGTTQGELYRMARQFKLKNYLVYETERHGQRWYVLVAGEYATLTAANQALKGLPAEIRRNGPWVRSLRQVQRELK
ncbi:SPOR domain-containing protein [Morganella morganii]|uniref:SPOR domain-containing protein n=1 Tax=Morganella morganii TaxID=582 RepID=UPI00068E87E2|nr:SPOR domain-containing protein [Morganella morganii]